MCLRHLHLFALILSFVLPCSLRVLANPLPLGTLTTNGSVPSGCPHGFTCTGFTVAVPGVTNNANGFIGVAAHSSAAPRGLVLLFTGGSGQGWWTSQTPELPGFANDLRAEGFTVVQVKWGTNWLESSPGNDAGTAHLGGRPATVIKHIHDNLYLPLDIPPHPAGQAGFVITGNSGGASQVGYALTHYGLEDILDVVIPTGGPPHSNLARAVLETDPSEPWYFDLGTRKFIDRGFGYFSGNGPAALQDPSFKPRWDAESVATGGDDYFHPQTRVHFIIGSSDRGMQALAGDYYNSLIAGGSPLVSWQIAANTPHGVFSTVEGRAALWSAITTTASIAFLGDYNHNGGVEAADYVVWRKTLGQTGSGMAADGNGNNEIDADDYNIWRAHFGRTADSASAAGATGSASAAVPEPATLLVAMIAAFGLSWPRRSVA
jgi:hypothetical protein